MADFHQIQAYPTPVQFVITGKGKPLVIESVGPVNIALVSISTPTVLVIGPFTDSVPAAIALTTIITGHGTEHLSPVADGLSNIISLITISTPTKLSLSYPGDAVPAVIGLTIIATPIKESTSITDSLNPSISLKTVTI